MKLWPGLFLIHQLKSARLFLQKHEDESEGWLHRQVRVVFCFFFLGICFFVCDDRQTKAAVDSASLSSDSHLIIALVLCSN